MKKKRRSKGRLPAWQQDLQRKVRLLASGGPWSSHVPPKKREALRWFLADGIFANASSNIILTYQAIYLMALGATRGEIGLLGALTNLMLPLAMLPGAWLARRAKSYKPIVVIASLISRLLLLGLVFLPYFSTRMRLISLGIVILAAHNLVMNLLKPAWTTMVGQIVANKWRGRYFSTRNIFMGLAALVTGLAVGQLVDYVGTPQGYQIAFGLAIGVGLIATYTFSRIREPQTRRRRQQALSGKFLPLLRQYPAFVGLCATTALWSFGVHVASPFFNVYLVDVTRASATALGISAAAASLGALPGQRVFGLLNDRRGARWVQRLTGFLIPLVPGIWGFMTQPWQSYPVQALSGFVWAGYNLASFNLLLEMTPQERQPSFIAFYQMIAGLGMSGGAVLGGWIAERHGYRAVFSLSALLRLIAAALFAFVVAKVEVHLPRVKLPKPQFPQIKWPKVRFPQIKWPKIDFRELLSKVKSRFKSKRK